MIICTLSDTFLFKLYIKMITEDYVSYEIAKLLKEKGFDEVTNSCYSQNGNQHIGERARYNSLISGKLLSCPTLQMTMKWLREKGYNVVVWNDSPEWEVEIQELNDGGFNVLGILSEQTFDTYEQAVEAALKYSLENLI